MMKKTIFSLVMAVAASVSLTCCGGGGGGGGSKAVVIEQMVPQGYDSCELEISEAFMGVEFEETRLEGTGNAGEFSIKSISMPDPDTQNDEVTFDNIQGTWDFHPNNSSRNEVYLTVSSHDAITHAPYENYKLTRVVVSFESKAQISDSVISGVTNQVSISYVRSDGSVGSKSIPFPANLRLVYKQ